MNEVAVARTWSVHARGKTSFELAGWTRMLMASRDQTRQASYRMEEVGVVVARRTRWARGQPRRLRDVAMWEQASGGRELKMPCTRVENKGSKFERTDLQKTKRDRGRTPPRGLRDTTSQASAPAQHVGRSRRARLPRCGAPRSVPAPVVRTLRGSGQEKHDNCPAT